jgi:polyisoprenoid-binding protein YceI
MNFFIRQPLLLIVSWFCLLNTAAGQAADSSNVIYASLLETSSMTIIGSSTLHDWEVEATDFSVQFRVPEYWFESQERWSGSDVAGLKVTVPVDKLDGGKNKMNRDLKDALNFLEYRAIEFTWEKISFEGDIGTGRRAEVEGLVTIAGETKMISFDADISLNEWSQIVAKGSIRLNMEEFGVDPPTAFFGVIRTDEIVNLSFELFFGTEQIGKN